MISAKVVWWVGKTTSFTATTHTAVRLLLGATNDQHPNI